MPIRTKILILLASLLAFSLGAVSLALFELGRAHRELERSVGHGVSMIRVVNAVTAGHLEQSVRVERALRHAHERERSPASEDAYQAAKADFERLSAEIWRSLQEGKTLAAESAAARGGDEVESVRFFAALLERVDASHNEYAHRVRQVFDHLDRGEPIAAAALAGEIQAQPGGFGQALGQLLGEVARRSETASARVRQGEDRALVVAGVLSTLTILLTAAVFVYCLRLATAARSLGGLLPICASCKKIRDDRGYWNQLEAYLASHSDAEFTHGLCSDCMDRMRAETTALRDARRSATTSAESSASGPCLDPP